MDNNSEDTLLLVVYCRPNKNSTLVRIERADSYTYKTGLLNIAEALSMQRLQRFMLHFDRPARLTRLC